MEARLRRLALLVAVSTFLGFGIASGYSYFQAKSKWSIAENYNTMIHNALIACEKDRHSPFCDLVVEDRKDREVVIDKMVAYRDQFDSFIIWTLVAPLMTMLMYFCLRWVMTGQAPRLPTRKKVRSTAAEGVNELSAVIGGDTNDTAKRIGWRYAIFIVIVLALIFPLRNYLGNGPTGMAINTEDNNQRSLETNQEIRILVASQDAEGVTQSQLNLVFLQNLEAHAVLRIKAILKNNGVISEPEIISEASYVESGPYKLAIIRLRSSDGSRAVFVNGIIGKELKRIACIRNSTEQISVTLGPCGAKVKEVFGVGF